MSDLGLKNDNTKQLLLTNRPIENYLHVIAVVSNPCEFKIRYKLTNEFIKRMESENNIILYVVELAYGNQPFEVTEANNRRHLQIRGEVPLWHKENMINLGVRYLLPRNWKAMAWIDADVEFESVHWASDALKLLNGSKDFVQLFTHAIDMDFNKQIMNTFTSFGYQYCKNFKKGSGMNYWHPGFAWACNRYAYEKMGGIYEEGILGSGDNIMCHSFINKGPESLKAGMAQGYIDFVANLQNKMSGLRLGYIPGSIRHYFHGKKENRNYYGREDILIKYKYNPTTFIKHNEYGLIVPTENFQQEFINDIMDYFKDRNEDEMIVDEIMSKNKTDKEVLEYKINFILHEFEKLKKKAGITNENDTVENKKIIADIKNAISNEKEKDVTEVEEKEKEKEKPKSSPVVTNNFVIPPIPKFPPIPPLPNVVYKQQYQEMPQQVQQRPIAIQFNNRIPFNTQIHNTQISQNDIVPFSNYQNLSFNNQLQILKNQIAGNNNHMLKRNKLKNMGF